MSQRLLYSAGLPPKGTAYRVLHPGPVRLQLLPYSGDQEQAIGETIRIRNRSGLRRDALQSRERAFAHNTGIRVRLPAKLRIPAMRLRVQGRQARKQDI